MKPKKIMPDGNLHMRITWDSGEEHRIEHRKLRFLCPCAGCVDEMSGVRRIKIGQIKPDVKPLEITPVGNYAIAIKWSDLHSTGMYAYERLYKLGAENTE